MIICKKTLKITDVVTTKNRLTYLHTSLINQRSKLSSIKGYSNLSKYCVHDYPLVV